MRRVGEVRGAATCDQDGLNEGDELVAGRRAQKPDACVEQRCGRAVALSRDGDGRHAVDAVLGCTLGFEDEIYLVNDDAIRQYGQLIEDLAGLEAGVTPERLGEEDEVDAPRHLGKIFAQPVLILRFNKRHAAIMPRELRRSPDLLHDAA